MNKVTIKEIIPMLQATRGEICHVLDELVMEGRLDLREDGVYFYKEKQTQKQELPLFFEFRTKDELDLIKRCFCADLTSVKTGLLLNLSDNTICKFYTYFRKIIYENQMYELKKYYEKIPQAPRIRTFFNIHIYFYYYEQKVFVSENNFNLNILGKCLSKVEDREFRKTYLKLTRKIIHNTMRNNLNYHITEQIWRMDKIFDDLIEELTDLLK